MSTELLKGLAVILNTELPLRPGRSTGGTHYLPLHPLLGRIPASLSWVRLRQSSSHRGDRGSSGCRLQRGELEATPSLRKTGETVLCQPWDIAEVGDLPVRPRHLQGPGCADGGMQMLQLQHSTGTLSVFPFHRHLPGWFCEAAGQSPIAPAHLH